MAQCYSNCGCNTCGNGYTPVGSLNTIPRTGYGNGSVYYTGPCPDAQGAYAGAEAPGGCCSPCGGCLPCAGCNYEECNSVSPSPLELPAMPKAQSNYMQTAGSGGSSGGPSGCCAMPCCASCGTVDPSGIGYGVFGVNGPVTLTEDGTIPLTARNYNTNFFTLNNGNIIFKCPGVYYVSVNANIPADTAVDATIQLMFNGQILNPPQLVIEAEGDDNYTTNASGDTVIYANAASALSLQSTAEVTFASATAGPIFTVTIIKLR